MLWSHAGQGRPGGSPVVSTRDGFRPPKGRIRSNRRAVSARVSAGSGCRSRAVTSTYYEYVPTGRGGERGPSRDAYAFDGDHLVARGRILAARLAGQQRAGAEAAADDDSPLLVGTGQVDRGQ